MKCYEKPAMTISTFISTDIITASYVGFNVTKIAADRRNLESTINFS